MSISEHGQRIDPPFWLCLSGLVLRGDRYGVSEVRVYLQSI